MIQQLGGVLWRVVVSFAALVIAFSVFTAISNQQDQYAIAAQERKETRAELRSLGDELRVVRAQQRRLYDWLDEQNITVPPEVRNFVPAAQGVPTVPKVFPSPTLGNDLPRKPKKNQ